MTHCSRGCSDKICSEVGEYGSRECGSGRDVLYPDLWIFNQLEAGISNGLHLV